MKMFIKLLARECSINGNWDYITNQAMSTFLVQTTITSFLNCCSSLLTGVPAFTPASSLFITWQPEVSFLNISQVLSLPYSKPCVNLPSHFEQNPKSLPQPTRTSVIGLGLVF